MRIPKLISVPIFLWAAISSVSWVFGYHSVHFAKADSVIPCAARYDEMAREKFLLEIQERGASMDLIFLVMQNSGFEFRSFKLREQRYERDGREFNESFVVRFRQVSLGYCPHQIMQLFDPDLVPLSFDRNSKLIATRAFSMDMLR